MTATLIRMQVPEPCRFSTDESAVLWRFQDGMPTDTIASELGLAEPIVKEYIKAILRKVRPDGTNLSATGGTDEQSQSTLCHDGDRSIGSDPTVNWPVQADRRANHPVHPSLQDRSAMATMTDPHHLPKTNLVEHRGYQIRLSQSSLEWIAFVARPKQRPTVIMAPERQAVLAKAYEWVDLQLASGQTPE